VGEGEGEGEGGRGRNEVTPTDLHCGLRSYLPLIYSSMIKYCHSDKDSRARDRGEVSVLLHYEKVRVLGMRLPGPDPLGASGFLWLDSDVTLYNHTASPLFSLLFLYSLSI
jgi:hypothetical protein